MAVSLRGRGCLKNIMAGLVEDAAGQGLTLDYSGMDELTIRDLAADAGVPLEYKGSDRNLLEMLAELLGSMVWALSGELGLLFGVSAATVTDDWVSSAVGTGADMGAGLENFVAGTDIATPISWASGVRWIECPAFVNNSYNVGINMAHIASSWMLSVRREDNYGPGNVDWGFYVEKTGVGAERFHQAIGPETDVPAIGIDGETGEVHIAINGAEVAIAQPSILPPGAFAGGGVLLYSHLNMMPADIGKQSSITMAALAPDFVAGVPGGFDMQGNAL